MADKRKIKGLRRDRVTACRKWIRRIKKDDAKAAPKNAKMAKVKIFDPAVIFDQPVDNLADAIAEIEARLDFMLADA